jgi:flagellar hook protein FlgE
MMRSMFSGISGLRSHQTMMDVVGNNIANINTAGYKSSVVTFQETMSQIVQGAGRPGTNQAGTNPIQVGLGVRVASTDSVFTPGARQMTGRTTDLSIQGDGFFIVEKAGSRAYSRAGNFNFDGEGNLTAPGGAKVMGWMADATGDINYSQPVQTLRLPLSSVIEPQVTTQVSVGGNLAADAAVGTEQTTTISVYDSLGNAHEMVITYTKTGANAWDVDATIGGAAATLSSTSVTFDPDGTLSSAATIGVSGVTPAGAAALSFDLDFATDSPLLQYGGTGSVEAYEQDGNGIGTLSSVNISGDGTVVGQFSNGFTRTLGAVGLAAFSNPAGLVRSGDSLFTESINSGTPLIGAPGTGQRGLLSSGGLEMSNVDLAAEFTNMIIAQRGFQANSRVITASDEILSDLVNMKR